MTRGGEGDGKNPQQVVFLPVKMNVSDDDLTLGEH